MDAAKKKENAHQYYLAHKEQMKDKSNLYYKTHRDTKIAYQKQRYEENKDIINLQKKRYYRSHKTQYLRQCKQYRQAHKDQGYLNGKNYRDERNLWLEQYKQEHGCLLCGSSLKLQFHHIDPAIKNFKLGSFKGSFETLQSEIAKCVVLCHLCHHKVHNAFRYHHPFPPNYELIEQKQLLYRSDLKKNSEIIPIPN
jgi:hypothetical protein